MLPWCRIEHDAGHFRGNRGVDGANGAGGDGAGHGHGVNHAGKVEIGGILRRAGGLERAVDARQIGTDDGGRSEFSRIRPSFR
jgi:hypothetical protein